MTTSLDLLGLSKQALQAARGWIITAIESPVAKRDLKLVDRVLGAIERYSLSPDFNGDNSIDTQALTSAQDICSRLHITDPQQITKIQLVITDAIKASYPVTKEMTHG